MKPTSLLLSALCLCASLPGCGTSTPGGPAPSTRLLRYDSSTDEPVQLLVEGVAVEIAPDAKQELSWVMNEGSGSTSILIRSDPGVSKEDLEAVQAGAAEGTFFWLQGDRLQVLDGSLRIGPRDYGPVAAGDSVVISAGTVSVNGAPRGPRDAAE